MTEQPANNFKVKPPLAPPARTFVAQIMPAQIDPLQGVRRNSRLPMGPLSLFTG
jgi:hypothetical protein